MKLFKHKLLLSLSLRLLLRGTQHLLKEHPFHHLLSLVHKLVLHSATPLESTRVPFRVQEEDKLQWLTLEEQQWELGLRRLHLHLVLEEQVWVVALQARLQVHLDSEELAWVVVLQVHQVNQWVTPPRVHLLQALHQAQA